MAEETLTTPRLITYDVDIITATGPKELADKMRELLEDDYPWQPSGGVTVLHNGTLCICMVQIVSEEDIDEKTGKLL